VNAHAAPPAIELAQLEVRAGRARLLGPLDLVVEPGEHVLVVGRSGSGKTTLLRAVAGLARPAAGRVRLFGRLASEGRRLALAPAQRGVGFLFQRGGLWPHMSVRAHLEFVLRAARVPRAERARRAAEWIERVGLAGLERRKPAALSGGEAQRLALARALVARTRLLLLDEPLGPLDAELRASLLDTLAAVHAELGLTILHVTHDPEEARRVATRCLRLDVGRIAGQDPIAPGAPQA